MNWEVIAQIATAVAVLIATFVFFWQIWVNSKERKYSKSEFCLQSALEGFKEAYDLLSNHNNDRVTWVAAARTLKRANTISEDVSNRSHLAFLNIQKDKYRRLFSDVLGYRGSQRTAAFFYGADNSVTDLDEAAKQSTGTEYSDQLLAIPEKVLCVILKFSRFPDDYEDPLLAIPDTATDLLEDDMMEYNWPALADYLKHRREHISGLGKLYKRDSG